MTRGLKVESQGYTDVMDITPQVASAVAGSGLTDGTITVFCPGSTGGITTIEFEGGAVADLQEALERIAPGDAEYRHHQRWGDDNGHSHVRAALIGPSLTVPFVKGCLSLGTWQQIVFIDFDTRPRSRRLVLQVVGE